MEPITFFGLPLSAWPGRVMTPRRTSEQLVAEALRLLGDRPARVADVGTGSGALAIAIASRAPRAAVWATDTSPRAVRLARRNVRRLGLEGRIAVCRGDLLDSVPGSLDLVVANLPYLPWSAASTHPDLAAEPGDAVFADGDGLGPYRRLVAASEERLTEGGALALQLHGEIVVASREELPALSDALGEPRPEISWVPSLVAA
jgi:release factor glutamine methyltransferase